MYCDYDINMCIDFFVTHLNVIIDKHAPLKYKKVRQNNVPYMNSELRKLNYQRNMLRIAKNKHPCPANFERYRILRNKCVKAKLKSQRQYFSERCDGGSKNQHFWPTIKPFISSKCNLKENIILRGEDGIINDATSVAKIFNEYFTKIAFDIGYNDPIPDDYDNDDVLISLIRKYDNHPSVLSIKSSLLEHGTFEFKHVDTNQIFQILRNMDDKKATGYEGIPCKLLKIGAYPLAEILCKLFNISTSECRFPDKLKLDLSKAFDSLPHGLLVAKLFAYGVALPACKLLCSYLHNRHQRVKIHDAKSDWLSIEKGVPQGSILGPLLFNIFINDIFFIDNDVTIYNYADDNCVSYAHNDIDIIKNVLESDVKKMLYWFKINSLEANPSKFQSMLLKNKNVNAEDFNIIVDNDTIDLTASMNVLGINIDDKLNFNSHVSNMCNKAGRQLNVLQWLKGSLDYASRLSIYKSFIMSNFNYCPVVWMFTSKSSLSKLEDIQRRALRFVLDDYTSIYHELLNKANVPGEKIMALRYLAIEVYKCVNGLNPKYLNDILTIKKCKYDLRDDSLINRNKVSTTSHGLKSFKDYGAKIWNLLPESCKGAISLREIKDLIKSWNGPKYCCSVCLHFT